MPVVFVIGYLLIEWRRQADVERGGEAEALATRYDWTARLFALACALAGCAAFLVSRSSTSSRPNKATIADFHVYALEWGPGEFRWFCDDKEYARQSFWWSSGKVEGINGVPPRSEADLEPWPAPFDHSFYLVMNLAIGGRFVGTPNKTTPFPAEMQVDYVRVYEKVGGYGETKPRGDGKVPFAR